jgi:hypothetical protein
MGFLVSADQDRPGFVSAIRLTNKTLATWEIDMLSKGASDTHYLSLIRQCRLSSRNFDSARVRTHCVLGIL